MRNGISFPCWTYKIPLSFLLSLFFHQQGHGTKQEAERELKQLDFANTVDSLVSRPRKGPKKKKIDIEKVRNRVRENSQECS